MMKFQDKLQIVVGKMDDEVDVDRAIETSDAVIACINHTSVRPDHPMEFEATFKNILESLERNGTKRFIMVSSGNASEALWEVCYFRLLQKLLPLINVGVHFPVEL